MYEKRHTKETYIYRSHMQVSIATYVVPAKYGGGYIVGAYI